MIRAIVWKEIREQGLIALTLVVLGSGVLAAAAALADPPVPNASPTELVRFLGAGRLATLMLAVTAGIVCGGAVFAAEREAGTFSFLDSLPTTRWHLWVAKLIAGLGLATVQITILLAVAVMLGMMPSAGWAFAIGLYALLAFFWGMLGSTAARTTLGSVGIAIPAASLTAIALLIPVTLFFQSPGSSMPRPAGAVLFLAGMFGVPLCFSAWLFTGLDRTRAADDIASTHRLRSSADSSALAASEREPAPRRPRFGAAALLWLSARQLVVPGLAISAFAFFFGLALLLPASQPFLMWPVLALTAGVVAGVTAFADEQSRGSSRYWGEQRLPIGRVWAFKIGVHFAFCLWLLVLLALPMTIRTQFEDTRFPSRGHTLLSSVFRAPLFDEIGGQGWKYLLVPAVYGFTAGHLCGLVFRKLVVACGVAGIVGGVGAVAWGPSLLAGGVKHWQLWLPPIVALVTARKLMRAWTADQMPTRPALIALASGCAAAFLALCAGIAYRVLEVPDRADGEADVQYVAGLPSFDDNASGRDYRTAADRFVRLAAAISPAFDRVELPGPVAVRRERVEERLDRATRAGWPTNDEQLTDWLDKMFSEIPHGTDEATWQATAELAATRPTGIYEYPQLVNVTGSSAAPLENSRRMAIAILARGLQRQAAGDPNHFLAQLRIALSLARTLRNSTVVGGYIAGVEVERSALAALDRWLDRLPLKSELFRPAIQLVLASEPATPFDPKPYFLAERYVLREGMKVPAQWLPNLLTQPGGDPDGVATEVDLVGIAWAVPWERERTRRLIGLGFEAGMPEDPYVVLGRPGLGFLIGRARNPNDLIEIDQWLCAHRRAALLKLALRAHRAERGEYPPALDDLVAAGYLTALPTDPFDSQRGFGYRISKPPGEVLLPPQRNPNERAAASGLGPPPGSVLTGLVPSVTVPPGHPILWSVGPDKLDQGGVNTPSGTALSLVRPPDIVYLVPAGQ